MSANPSTNRMPGFGANTTVTLTDFLDATCAIHVRAQLTTTHITRAAACPVFISVTAGNLRVDIDGLSHEARTLARALNAAADAADRMDAGVICAEPSLTEQRSMGVQP